MICMIATLKMRLEPTSSQRCAIDMHIDRARYLYNAIITACKSYHRKNGMLPSQFDLNNLCTRIRNNVPFLKELHSMSLQYTASCALQACRRCLHNSGKEDDKTARFPRYRNKGRMSTYGFMSGKFFSIVHEANNNGRMRRRLKIGKIKGSIKCYNQSTPLHGEPKTVKITRKGMGTYSQYFASVTYDFEGKGNILLDNNRKDVGVDVGLSCIATLSDGTAYPNDHIYSKKEKTIQKKSRQLSKAMRSQDNVRKGKILNHMDHLFRRIHNVRKNTIETISREIVDRYDTIAMEDLSVKGLKTISKNKGMKKSYDDASLGELMRRISFKAESAGQRTVMVNPKDTSQTCSGCGAYVKKDLSQRMHECPDCGLVLHRDINAAINILHSASTGEAVPVATGTDSPASRWGCEGTGE